MNDTTELRTRLDDVGIQYSKVGRRGTMWNADGIGWVAMEGYGGGLWLRTSGTVSACEAFAITTERSGHGSQGCQASDGR